MKFTKLVILWNLHLPKASVTLFGMRRNIAHRLACINNTCVVQMNVHNHDI